MDKMNKNLIPVLVACMLTGCSSSQLKSSHSLQTLSNISEKTTEITPVKLADKKTTAKSAKDKNLDKLAKNTPVVDIQQGVASWYGENFHGKKTATGEFFDMYGMTAAHGSLPIPSYAKVTNVENNRSIIVRVNDRGPFHDNRVLDLSYSAAQKLGFENKGKSKVEIKVLTPKQVLTQLKQESKNIHLQVGTFNNKQIAEDFKKTITKNNLPSPEIITSSHKGATLYKLQLDVASSKIEKVNQQLAQLGVKNPQFLTN